MGIQVGARILATVNMSALNILAPIISCPYSRDYSVYLTSFFGNYYELEEHLWEAQWRYILSAFYFRWCEEVACTLCVRQDTVLFLLCLFHHHPGPT